MMKMIRREKALHNYYAGFLNNRYFCRVWILSKYQSFIETTHSMQRRYRTISDLRKNESALTIAVTDPALAGKLTAMGVLPGTRIELVRPAPFGNAYYIKVDGVRLALREEEAACILLEI